MEEIGSQMFIRDPKTARLGEEILLLEVGYLPEFYKKKAEVELHDTPKNREEALLRFKEMAKNDKYLKDLTIDDDFLLMFLLAQKYNVPKAFVLLKNFIQFREENASLYVDLRFEQISKWMKKKIVSLLPWRCQDGCSIFLIELDNWIPEEFPLEEVKRTVVLYLWQSFLDPMTQVNGYKAIFDVKSNPMKHLRHCTPHNMYLIYHGFLNCFPARYKALHFVNPSRTFKAAWGLLKPLLPDKLKARMFFHSEPEQLLNYFPASILPVQYGGELTNYDMTEWLHRVMQPEMMASYAGANFLDKVKKK